MMEDLINQVEATIPVDWKWVIRKCGAGEKGKYICNIYSPETPIPFHRNVCFADTAEQAVIGSLASYKGEMN